jgi:chromosome segregation ATPase
MSETFWESGAAVEAQPQGESKESHGEQGSLAVTAGDFSALEERILRAVELVKREKQERTAAEARATHAEERAAHAEERAAQAEQRATQAEELVNSAETRATQSEAQLRDQTPIVDRMQSEINALKGERDHVRGRVERLLQQLEGLEL